MIEIYLIGLVAASALWAILTVCIEMARRDAQGFRDRRQMAKGLVAWVSVGPVGVVLWPISLVAAIVVLLYKWVLSVRADLRDEL